MKSVEQGKAEMQITKLEIKNYRGIEDLTIKLDSTTVLIGENNTGKTTVLHALRACLQTIRSSGRSQVFDEFDFHLDSESADPALAKPIELTVTFEEINNEEWSEEIEQKLGGDAGIISFIGPNEIARVQLRVTSEYSQATQEIETGFDFLDADGNPLPDRNRRKLSSLQQIRPLFYLSALRDAGREFSRTAQFWSPFVKSSQITPDKKQEIEEQLLEINNSIIEAHGTFKKVQDHLSKVQQLVSVGEKNIVSVDAIPARIFDMLSRTQVNIASATGAKLPIGRHGEGTQSLSVLMLFDAYLQSDLSKASGGPEVKPVVALEEPEAHLHPAAVRSLWQTIEKIDGQKIIATHSGDLLSEVEVFSIRRLYRYEGSVRIGKIPNDLFYPDQLRMFDHWVRRTRGELFFARTWLLVEGATEVIILSGAAKVLEVDLEKNGVRLIEFSQSNVTILIQAANALGIAWHVFTDSDPEGVKYKTAAEKELSNTYKNRRHITALPAHDDMEPYLYKNGFSEIYEANISEQKRKRLTIDESDSNYPDKIVKCLNASKPEMAHKIVEEMESSGKQSVPTHIKYSIYKAAALGR